MITNMARFSAALVAVVLRLVSVAAWALFMSSGGVPPVGPPPPGDRLSCTGGADGNARR